MTWPRWRCLIPRRFGRNSRGPLLSEDQMHNNEWDDAPGQIWSMAGPQRFGRKWWIQLKWRYSDIHLIPSSWGLIGRSLRVDIMTMWACQLFCFCQSSIWLRAAQSLAQSAEHQSDQTLTPPQSRFRLVFVFWLNKTPFSSTCVCAVISRSTGDTTSRVHEIKSYQMKYKMLIIS